MIVLIDRRAHCHAPLRKRGIWLGFVWVKNGQWVGAHGNAPAILSRFHRSTSKCGFQLVMDQVGVLGWAGLIALARRPRFDSAQRSLEAGVGVSGGEGGLVEVDNVCQNGLGVGMIVAQANHENGKAF